MAEFKIGDKVRSKNNHNVIGIVSEICWDYWYGEVDQTVTIRIMPEGGYLNYETFNARDIEKIDEEKDAKEMTSYKVGDIVVHRLIGKTYQICRENPGDDNRYDLERFNNYGMRCLRYRISFDEIRLANCDEISEFYRLKELYETSEKIKEKLKHSLDAFDSLSYVVRDQIATKDVINKERDIHMDVGASYPKCYPIKSSYPGHGGALSELSKELMKFKKEKETNDMRKFKIGDVVVHWVFGKGIVMGYEECSNIRVEFEDYSVNVIHEDSCHLVTRSREFHDLCGRRPIPKFKQVIYKDPATIIFWEDSTKTVVKCDGTRTITLADGTTKIVKTSEGEKYDELKGLTMGIVKKIYGLKKFYNIYEDVTKYVTGKKTLLNIEKGLAESVVKDLYGIKKINSKDDIYKVAMTDNFYISTERK